MQSLQRALYLIPDYRFSHIFNVQVIYFVSECQQLIHTTNTTWIILKYNIHHPGVLQVSKSD